MRRIAAIFRCFIARYKLRQRAPIPNVAMLMLVAVTVITGCRSSTSWTTSAAKNVIPAAEPIWSAGIQPSQESSSPIRLVSEKSVGAAIVDEELADELPQPQSVFASQLPSLEAIAVTNNPDLRRLQQEVAAATARVHYADKLPDPTIGANLFAHPIETAAGSQRANLSVMQMIPWLERLDAQSQQVCFEAMALQQVYLTERLKVIGDLRANWIKLYVLGRQRETIQANQQLLNGLSELVTARIGQNRGSVGDVTLLTVEIGKLEQQLVTTDQQLVSTMTEINRLCGQPADTVIPIPTELSTVLPDWSFELLSPLARQRQPAIAAAQLRAAASRWGVEVARLKRRPDVSLGAAWFAIDDNRNPSTIVDVGRDAWSVGAQVSIPLWTAAYDAMEDEARWKHFASHASVEDLQLRFDAAIRDLWEQARAADQTTTLYRETIIPQARQTLDADQQALANGSVDLDRVIQDIRGLLLLEQGFDRATGDLALAIVRIQQAVGFDLEPVAALDAPIELESEPITKAH